MLKRQFILVFLLIVLFTSCKSTINPINSYQAIVCGQIINDSTVSPVELSSYLAEIAGDTKTYPDKNGRFKFTFQLPTEFEFTFSYNGALAKLLINPSDSIFISIDTKDSISFVFSGTNSKMQTDLNNLERIIPKTKIDYSELIRKYKEDTPEQYLKFRTTLYHEDLKALDNILKKGNVPTIVKKYYKSSYLVNYSYELIHFLGMASIYQGLNTTKEGIPDNYVKTIDSLCSVSIDDFHVQEYHNFITLYSQMFSFEIHDTLLNALRHKDKLLTQKILMDYDLSRFSGFPKDYLITKSINSLIDNSYITDEVFNKYSEEVSMDYFKSFLKKKYNEYKLFLNAESDSNKIHLIDLSESDTTSILEIINKNHFGKTLYIDVWGTWCGSCISKFAYMPEMRNLVKDNNIEFIFLAIASPKNQWEKVIISHKLEGYHYLLNEKQKKEINGVVDISGIPHYFIINKDGKIVNPDAMGPSDAQIIKQLETID